MKIVQVTDDLSLTRDLDQGTNEQYEAVVSILKDVKQKGDEALIRYTEKFDGVCLDTLQVTNEEIKQAYEELSLKQLTVIKEAAANIKDFHEKQVRKSWFTTKEDGTILGQK